LGRRIAKPLEEAEATTRRIATGDLDARVAVTEGADPEVTSLAASINAMAENLDRLRGLERQFLLSVSHDLRTPLTSIRGFAEAISDGATDDTVRAAGVIASEARRLERLVADLLDLARLDAREFKLDPQPVDVAVVVRETAEGFRPAARDAGVTLTVNAPNGEDGSATLTLDRDRLAQVVANLVENALCFATSRVDIDVEPGARATLIVVSDDGPGIPAGEHARVFDRLYQPARAAGVTSRKIGSGLGLAIVAELVQAMGGSVQAADGRPSGTRVTVSLAGSSSTFD
jgi:two-component system sensor histidine kinase BaeS